MAANKVLGLIFPNSHDGNVAGLTEQRCIGSLPFGARYRMIDFALSNFINSDITDIGVVAQRNYQSLMDHIGTGKDWDLARKHGGLTILPPFGHSSLGYYTDRIHAIESVRGYILSQDADTVVLADCDCVCSVDLRPALEAHAANNADITILCTGAGGRELPPDALFLTADGQGRVTELRTAPVGPAAQTVGMNLFIIRRDVLLTGIHDLATRNMQNFNADFLQASLGKLAVYAWRFDGYTGFLSSRMAFFNANMDLLSPVRRELFDPSHPVHTRVRDEAPVIYGLGSLIRNSTVADGCYIDGEVENSIIFRGVHIAKGCRIRNCILMRGAVVGEGTTLEYVILDKNVTIGAGRHMQGCRTCPVYVDKGANV